MEHIEYAHYNSLALTLLLDANIDRMPVDITKIAQEYNLTHLIDYSKSRYINALAISQSILNMFGYNTSDYRSAYLAIKILAPFAILNKLGVNSFSEFVMYTDMPYILSAIQYEHFRTLQKLGTIGKRNIERRLVRNCKDWIAGLNC